MSSFFIFFDFLDELFLLSLSEFVDFLFWLKNILGLLVEDLQIPLKLLIELDGFHRILNKLFNLKVIIIFTDLQA